MECAFSKMMTFFIIYVTTTIVMVSSQDTQFDRHIQADNLAQTDLCPTTLKPTEPGQYPLVPIPTDDDDEDFRMCCGCNPGYFYDGPCNATDLPTTTRCIACPSGTFIMQRAHNITQCTTDTMDCPPGMDYIPGSAEQKHSCYCPSGFFLNEGQCQPHKTCPLHYGVKTHGNPLRDTECESCIQGFDSLNVSATEKCSPTSKNDDMENTPATFTDEATTETSPTSSGSKGGKPGGNNTLIIVIALIILVLVMVVMVVGVYWCRHECKPSNQKQFKGDPEIGEQTSSNSGTPNNRPDGKVVPTRPVTPGPRDSNELAALLGSTEPAGRNKRSSSKLAGNSSSSSSSTEDHPSTSPAAHVISAKSSLGDLTNKSKNRCYSSSCENGGFSTEPNSSLPVQSNKQAWKIAVKLMGEGLANEITSVDEVYQLFRCLTKSDNPQPFITALQYRKNSPKEQFYEVFEELKKQDESSIPQQMLNYYNKKQWLKQVHIVRKYFPDLEAHQTDQS